MQNNFYDLATKLQEDGASGGVAGPTSGGATTMDMISYLPTQVGVVRAALKGLGKKKRKWGLEILEGEGGRKVKFEDALQISVPDEHWQNFQEMFDGDLRNSESFELPELIHDSTIEDKLDLEDEKASVYLAIESFLRNPNTIRLRCLYERWKACFGVVEDKTPPKTLLSVVNLDEGIKSLYKKVIRGIEDDRGQLEMLSERIEEDPLPILQKTGDYRTLAGVRVRSKYQGVGLVLECQIGFDLSSRLSVLVEDKNAVDVLQENLSPDTRKVGNVFFFEPITFLQRNIIQNIRDLIENCLEDNN